MAKIIDIRTKTVSKIPDEDYLREDCKKALEIVLARKPRSVFILSWDGEVSEGFNIDYCDLVRLSDVISILEIAKAKLLRENFN